MAIVKDLGMVTAYAYAVAGGYEGTEAEFTELLGQAGVTLEQLENLSAVAVTLAPGSEATASYSDGVLTFGIPQGATGETGQTGPQGPEGPTGNGIASIAKTGTAGLVDTYTITFTDGTTTTFTVTNGADGDITNVAQAFDATKAYSVGDMVLYQGALYAFTAAHPAGAWIGSDAQTVILADEVTELKSDFTQVETAVYTTETYVNQSTGQVGDQSMFIAYFNSPTYIATFQPLFAVQGTFKWGIFTANGAVDNNASRGDTTWKDTLETGSVISLKRMLNPNEALVVQAISPAVSRNGLALASCEIAAHFARLGGTYVADYFGKEYGYPAIFTAPKIKDIPDATNMSKSVYVFPDGYATHSEVIASAISKAVANGSRHVILQKGDFIITDTIKVPSNFHLEFDNANVKLASGANCNIIASANIDDLLQAENITITANNCVLDGNHSEQTIYNNSYKRIGVLMFNVDGFDISGFTVKDTHGWGMSFESGCQNGKIHDIRIDQDGNHVNQDGIDIRGGCHDIEIYNITGYAHDDCIACTALLGNVMQVLNDGTNGKDIYNISIHDIEMESGYCNVVDLICHDTCKTHDISVYNINDRSEAGKTFISMGAYSHTVRIGNYDFSNYAISGTTGTKDDMYNINVYNVVCNSYIGIGIGWACKDVTVRNIKMLENVGRGIELHDAQQVQFIVQNLLIASVYAIGASDFLFWRNVKGNVQNALLSDITVMNCSYFLYDFYADMAYQNFAVLRANLYKGTSLYYLADDSAMYLDAFYVPSASAFYILYPSSHVGQVTFGNNMPFRS